MTEEEYLFPDALGLAPFREDIGCAIGHISEEVRGLPFLRRGMPKLFSGNDPTFEWPAWLPELLRFVDEDMKKALELRGFGSLLQVGLAFSTWFIPWALFGALVERWSPLSHR